MVENIRMLANAFSQTPPNELEQRLQEQAKPGAIPSGSLGIYALNAALRALAITNPERAARVKAAQVNGASAEVLSSILRGEQ